MSYGKLSTEFYDLDKPEAPTDAAAYYITRARSARGRVLEPMCGSGRFLLPMLRAGIEIDGMDASPEMLGACRRRVSNEGFQANLYEQPLERLSLPFKYAMAFVPSGSIGLVSRDEDLQSALSRLHHHLEPGAPLLLEVEQVADDGLTEAELDSREVHCPDGASIHYRCRVTRSRTTDCLLYSGVYEKRRDGRTVASEEEELVLRQLGIERLTTLLAQCGFNQVDVVDSTAQEWLKRSGCSLIEAR